MADSRKRTARYPVPAKVEKWFQNLPNGQLQHQGRSGCRSGWPGLRSRSIGQKVEGSLEKKETFGCFINLKPGITGLLPKSRISTSGSDAIIDKLKEGQRLWVIIESINPTERKISLAPADGAVEENWQKFSDDDASALGDLGEKLKQALKNK